VKVPRPDILETVASRDLPPARAAATTVEADAAGRAARRRPCRRHDPHLTLAQHDHINFYGTYSLDIDAELRRDGQRALRVPA
jgi:hypothetical protein